MLPASFVFLNEMPLLPSGKVDRRALTALEHVHPEPAASFIAPRAEAEKILAEIWASVLAVERIGIDDNFFELGGDSILSLQIIARANKAGLHLTPQALFERQTIRELAEAASRVTAVRAEQERVVGEARLSPIQRWFFEQQLSDARHYNQAIMLEAQAELEAAVLERVVGCLLEHHDALRLRFTRNKAAGWRQIYAAVEENNVFSVIDLSQLANAQQAAAVELMSAQLQASLNLSQGPLVRVALFNLGRSKRQRLLLVIHHLAVDAVSWRILLEDMQTACQQLGRGEGVKLPPKTISYKEWSNRLAELARTQRLAQEELAYWLAEPRTRIARLPVDHESGENTEASARSITVSLSAAETRSLLQEVPSAYRTQINDLLLTSLAEAFCRWTGQPSLLVDLEGHGREQITEDLDLTRTVGWFTAINPMLLEMRETDAGAVLKSVKEQLRAVPRKGIGYGLLRYLSGDEEVRNRFAALPQAEVSFNYLGQLDRVFASEVFKFVREESAAARSRRNRRSYLIDVVAQVRGGELHVEWVYSQAVHERETIERVAESYIRSLRKLIAHCLLPEAGSFTPSDFPEAELSQKDLDDLIAELD
jgi:non-ribosomal peptide synthase protein (TIGR01720 family)